VSEIEILREHYKPLAVYCTQFSLADTTARRHIKQGVNGVRLESVRIRRKIYVSAEAVVRFSQRLEAAAAARKAGAPAPEPAPTPARRARDQERTRRRLKELKIL
jgi:hypothetical protein